MLPPEGEASEKLEEASPLTTSGIKETLDIPGYDLVLPETWAHHHQARIIVYIRKTLKYKVIKSPAYFQDIPSVTLTASRRGEKSTIVNYIQ